MLAWTGVEGVTPWLTFELGLEREMHNLLTACWVAKLWAESVALVRRERGLSLDAEVQLLGVKLGEEV